MKVMRTNGHEMILWIHEMNLWMLLWMLLEILWRLEMPEMTEKHGKRKRFEMRRLKYEEMQLKREE